MTDSGPMIDRRTVLLGLGCCLAGCAAPAAEERASDDELYQVSTVDALFCGHFADETPISEVLDNGGFGLGTVNGLDGELVVVDGQAYAVRGDGTAVEVPEDTKTPFAAVTEFDPDTTVELADVRSFTEFTERMTERLPRTDHAHALRVEGTFEFLQTRSVHEQVEPYPTLEAVIENENIFDFTDVEGTMATFFIPEQFERIHPPGYHAHFVTEQRDGGGHVYDLRAGSLTVEIDHLDSVEVELPEREVEEYPPC
jgi:acetolactate decarboxylase